MPTTRREFLGEVGCGMLIASIGTALASDLGIRSALAAADPDVITFGKLEPLVCLMQETSAGRLQPALVERLQKGTDITTLVTAGALANARTFGGQDYVGYHAFMALIPAFEMARELPPQQRPLPVLKVLYRNTARIQEQGGRKREMLHVVDRPVDRDPAELRTAVRRRDMAGAERIFAGLARGEPKSVYMQMQDVVRDDIDVHRVVLAWRAWDMLRLAGPAHAHTLLRQSIRHCVDRERTRVRKRRPEPGVRRVLPKLLDEYRLAGRTLGRKQGDDAWMEALVGHIYGGTSAQAAAAAAAALAEGYAPAAVSEAISLAANRLLLHDHDDVVHGASIGVHASDSANAWRNIVSVSDAMNTVSSVLVAAYHVGGRANRVGRQPFPYRSAAREIRTTDPAALRDAVDAAVRERDQRRVCALVERYGELGHPADPLFERLLRYAVSEDGKLHAEKYYRTVREEFAATRPAFRWRHLVGLARVTASEFGTPAPGQAQARRLLRAG